MILKGDNMRVVISGGGTGGHIYPAVAIIEELKRRDENIEILYIGSKNSMESELIPSLNINFKSIEVMGLPRKINKKFFKSVFILFKGLSQAKKILKEFKPDVVIGTGGFVTGPVLYKAHKLGIYTIFHEQNSYPGITNRILSRYVDSMAVTFRESIKFFSKSSGNFSTSYSFQRSSLSFWENTSANTLISTPLGGVLKGFERRGSLLMEVRRDSR